MEQRDLVVIGGGSGGLVVASGAAQLGLSVTLVDADEHLGGDCLHYGCVPSKALLHTARVAALMRRTADFGLPAVEPAPVDLKAVNASVGRVVAAIQRHDAAERFRGYGCEVLAGRAHFSGTEQVQVGGRQLRSRRLVIATGSSPVVPPLPGLEECGYITNRGVFTLPRLPARLGVLGGGPVGVELAQAFARLGSRVTLLQRGPRILPRDDEEAAAVVAEALRADGVAIATGSEVVRVSRAGDAKRLHCRSANGTTEIEVDEILVAVGRRPNTDDLGLELAGVAVGRRGVKVDSRLRTSNRRIHACGDVCGPYQFTHTAEYQAGVVLANVAFGIPRRVDYRAVPWCTYSDPELAQVGLTEGQAREQGIDCETVRFDMSGVDRAVTERETQGFIKLLVDRRRLIGATLVGGAAGELLPELVLALQMRLPIGRISAAIHAYPTRAQLLRRASNNYFAPRLFGPIPRAAVRWVQRLLP